MKTAVIYARFSCSKQREASIEDQLRVCEEWCAREGYTVVARYCDYAMSGRTDDRPEFKRMISNAGESSIVLVYMMDRFSRDVYDAPIYKKKLRDKGVKVVSATETMPDGPEAILIESIYEAMAAMESAHTSRRVKRGMEGNAMKCMHNGVVVFGYHHTEDGGYELAEDEAEIVREVFSRRLEGETMSSIAKDIMRRGVTFPNGKPVGYSAVYQMLRNEKYTGVYKWGDIRVEGGMPRIISDEEFYMATHGIFPKQRAFEQWGSFPLTGRAICGGCGMNLVGTSGRNHAGIKYEYYRCSKKCGTKAMRAEVLEQSVVDALRELLSDRDKAMRIAQIVAEHAQDADVERRIAEAEKRKVDAERKLSRVVDAVADGMDVELAKAKIDILKAKRDAAEAELRIQKTAKGFDVEDFADFLQFGATLDDATLLDAFVYQVVLGDDEILVTLNYDMDDNEPARLRLRREIEPPEEGGSTVFSLVDQNKNQSNLEIAYLNGAVVVRFPRAA